MISIVLPSGQSLPARNLQPILRRASIKGVLAVHIYELHDGGATLIVDFPDRSAAIADFASLGVCRDWVNSRRSWKVGYQFIPASRPAARHTPQSPGPARLRGFGAQ